MLTIHQGLDAAARAAHNPGPGRSDGYQSAGVAVRDVQAVHPRVLRAADEGLHVRSGGGSDCADAAGAAAVGVRAGASARLGVIAREMEVEVAM